jgi:AraC-like DNA-binding protein
VDYRELSPPDALKPLVKTGWTLATGGGPEDEYGHVATPDGCVEIIRRLGGRSSWGKSQPPCFVAGLITRPVELSLGGDSRFVGLRLWPWAWNALGRVPCRDFLDRWLPLPDDALPTTLDEAFAIFDATLDGDTAALAVAILASRSAGELVRRSGRPARALQRWFERQIGVAPRTYFRLLRFQESLAGLPAAEGTLADHAAAHGYADQAHMARDYRAMAGAPASSARARARPPFL